MALAAPADLARPLGEALQKSQARNSTKKYASVMRVSPLPFQPNHLSRRLFLRPEWRVGGPQGCDDLWPVPIGPGRGLVKERRDHHSAVRWLRWSLAQLQWLGPPIQWALLLLKITQDLAETAPPARFFEAALPPQAPIFGLSRPAPESGSARHAPPRAARLPAALRPPRVERSLRIPARALHFASPSNPSVAARRKTQLPSVPSLAPPAEDQHLGDLSPL
mmetsp:Transcript_16142/g.30117  ORF Transcript_16142/g.30117 Transcript_16142/m.30117 type:complete len:221 (+) Transcript_16142:69-731(+)